MIRWVDCVGGAACWSNRLIVLIAIQIARLAVSIMTFRTGLAVAGEWAVRSCSAQSDGTETAAVPSLSHRDHSPKTLLKDGLFHLIRNRSTICCPFRTLRHAQAHTSDAPGPLSAARPSASLEDPNDILRARTTGTGRGSVCDLSGGLRTWGRITGVSVSTSVSQNLFGQLATCCTETCEDDGACQAGLSDMQAGCDHRACLRRIFSI